MTTVIKTTMHLLAVLLSLLTLLPCSQGRLECRERVADVVFLLDSSISIRETEWAAQLAFLQHLVSRFTISPDHVRVAVITFSSSVRVDIKLNQHMSRDSLQHAIGQIRYMGRGTNTGDAIRHAHTHMFQEENGSRPWAAHIMVLITDGHSINTRHTTQEASIARSQGMELFVIGVGYGVDERELRDVASDPDSTHFFRVDNYASLRHIENSFASTACHRPMQEDEPHSAQDAATKRCGGKPADVFFLLDSSSSIWRPDFQDQLHFVSHLLHLFDLGQDRTRVGVAVYSDDVQSLVSLTDTQTRHSIKHALKKARHLAGRTNTGVAIRWVRTEGFAKARREVAHVIIILTDGQSSNVTDTVTQARRAHREGVYVFAVGIGNETDVRELMQIASDPDEDFVFHVDNFGGLDNIRELLAIKTCDVPAPDYVSDQSANGCHFTKPTHLLFAYNSASLNRLESDAISDVIRDVVSAVDAGSDAVRYGMLRGNCYEGDNMNIMTGATGRQLQAALDVPHHNDLHILLRKLRLQGYLDDVARPQSHKVVVLFVGSKLLNPQGALLEAKRLKFNGARLVVVAFGSGRDNVDTLREMASVPLVETASHDSLARAKDVILERLCDVSVSFV